MKKMLLFPVMTFVLIAAKANDSAILGCANYNAVLLNTATTTYNIYYLSGSASVEYGNTTAPYYDLSTLFIYCDQYGGDLPVITPISHSASGGFYTDKFVASSEDGVYNVYFIIYGQTNGQSGYIEVTDTEYIPA